MQTMTLKVGTLGYWHVVHIVLSVMTAGAWLIVYAAHAVIAGLTRPSVTVEVPEGGRVEYYRGYPNVLGPGEYLDVEPWWRRPGILAAVLSPLGIAAAVLIWASLA